MVCFNSIQVKAAPLVSAPVVRTAPFVAAAPAPIVKSAPIVAAAPAPLVRTAPVAVAARIEEADSYPAYQFAYNVQDSLTGDSKSNFMQRMISTTKKHPKTKLFHLLFSPRGNSRW